MKTEDLKALGLSDEQVQRVFAMNGEEMNGLKASVATLTAERDTARTSLADANKKLEGYDPEWKAKAAQAQQQADQKVAELKAGYAADSAASGLKFTSDSAKKAFLSDLKAKNLPLQDDGTLLGFDDYVASYKKTDPGAFAPEGGLPRVSGSATGTPAGPTTNEQANAAIRAAFGHR